MTDREALLKAVMMLGNIGVVAGGFVSKSQRAQIKELEQHILPYQEQELLDNGWVALPGGGYMKASA